MRVLECCVFFLIFGQFVQNASILNLFSLQTANSSSLTASPTASASSSASFSALPSVSSSITKTSTATHTVIATPSSTYSPTPSRSRSSYYSVSSYYYSQSPSRSSSQSSYYYYSQSPSSFSYYSQSQTRSSYNYYTQSPSNSAYYQNTPSSGGCSAFPITGLSSQNNITVYGNTEGKGTFFYPNCDATGSSGTSWFELHSKTQSNITASTCGNYTNFDTIISVYSGSSCSGNLQCISYNNNYCSLQSSVTWNAKADTRYFIAVTGLGASEGNFILSFSQSPVNDVGCTNAFPVNGNFSSPVVIEGSNVNGITTEIRDCGLTFNSKVIWYQLFPKPYVPLNITTCSENTTFDTYLSLFYGDCASLNCVSFNDDSCELPTRAGSSTIAITPAHSSYYLAVFGYEGATGYYRLRVSQSA